ncbi:hypothetical protein RB195_012906 [Necator americanus]|uniref:Reverse transcriptase domain-containing protein n=1 Tax=Necator americanus TaxID=51031 RepID=A0ABR1DT49_NECAM
MTLINECLNCPIFRWSGQYYRQLRGLAIGQRLAPTLAIVFVAKIGKPIIDRKPLLYYRYIDDCCVVCSRQAELDTCFNLLNQQCPHIKFKGETDRQLVQRELGEATWEQIEFAVVARWLASGRQELENNEWKRWQRQQKRPTAEDMPLVEELARWRRSSVECASIAALRYLLQ